MYKCPSILHAHDAVGNVDADVAAHLALATEAPVVLDFLTGELTLFRVEDFAAAFGHLALALSARALAAAGRGEVYTVFCQRGEKAAALFHAEGVLAVDSDVHLAGGREIALGHQQDDNEQQDDKEEYYDTCDDKFHIAVGDLDVKAAEAHECHGHKSYCDESDAEALQGLGHVGVSHLLADGGEGGDGQEPADTGAEGIGNGVPYAGDGLRVGVGHGDALLHEERGAHDSAVHGNQGQEDTQS